MTDVVAPSEEGTADAAPVTSPWQVGKQHAVRRRTLLGGYLLLLAVVSAFFGFPTGREVVVAWLLAFLFVVVGGDRAAWRRAVVKDWLPFLLALFAYDLLRGLAKGSIERAHVLPMIRADEWLLGGTTPTVWLQEKLYTPDPAWFDYAIVPVYMSHFVVPIAVAAGLWTTSYARFRRFTATFLALTAITLVTYAAFPAMPPWLASKTFAPDGQTYLPFVERVTSHTLVTSGIPTIHSAVQQGEAYANPVAAVPSFHAAVPMLVLLVFWPMLRRVGRTLLVGYVLAMAFTLVYGGEHYVVDILLGWLYAALSVAAVTWVTRARLRRRAAAG